MENKEEIKQAEQPVENIETQPAPQGASVETERPPQKEGFHAKRDKLEKLKEEMQNKLDQTQKDLDSHKEQFLRIAAEYDNYRKRTEREKASLYADATAAAVVEFLPVADNLERALAQENCNAEDMRKGVDMVYSQLQKALENLNVSEMGKVGESFDPDMHNAVSHIDDEAAEENMIAQVYQKGYKIDTKVVRHATVVVAN